MPQPPLTWTEGWLWLSGSVVLAILWSNTAWALRRTRWRMGSDVIARLLAWRFSPWLLQVLRLLYYIGVPFAALLWGRDAVIARLLGLQRFYLYASSETERNLAVAANWLDWARDVGWAVTLALGAWAVLALGWWAYRRALVAAGAESAGTSTNVSVWVLLREAAYHEVHWAFYRNAPVLGWGTYWGSWSGLGLVALEAMLNPAWRARLADPQRAPLALLRGGLAVVSGLLFLLTQNLWLALALHWGVSWGVSAYTRALPLPACETERALA